MTDLVIAPILAFDTATTQAVVAVRASGAVRPLIVDRWAAGYRHGEELLGRIDRSLGAASVGLRDLGAVAVGTGPGAFTGLRVGVATAKGLAHGLGIPIVGIATSAALLAATRVAGSSDPIALFLPAGPTDRVLVVTDRSGRAGSPRRISPTDDVMLDPATTVVAVDLEGRSDPAASAAGDRARDGLGAALVELATTRLAAGSVDDLATLVPEYVTLPRGVSHEAGVVTLGRA